MSFLRSICSARQMDQHFPDVARDFSPWKHGQDGRATKKTTKAKHVPCPRRNPGLFCRYLSRRDAFRRRCRKTWTPFLFDVTMSGLPSPFRSVISNCVPTPESLSITCIVNSTFPFWGRRSSNQYSMAGSFPPGSLPWCAK